MPRPRKPAKTLAEVKVPLSWGNHFDEAICWRGGSEAQAQRHKRRGEDPCTNCSRAAAQAKEDREREKRERMDG